MNPVTRAPSESDLRWFGVIVLLFFGIVGGLVLWQLGSIFAARILWGTGLGIAGLYYLARPLRRPIYSVWMRAVTPIGWVVSHLVLGAIYYLVITPIALVMRLFGRDELKQRLDPSAPSYWSEREPAGDVARYFRQT